MQNWRSKIILTPLIDCKFPTVSSNSLGLLFNKEEGRLKTIQFKPLNEILNLVGEGDLIYLTFDRVLLEEDDKEYALDVMKLYNLSFNNILNVNDDKSSIIESLLTLLKEELYADNGSYILVKTLLKTLHLYLIRYQKQDYSKQDLSQKRVFEFLHLLESNFLEQRAGLFYATQIGISEKRLNQILKIKLNFTAQQLIYQRQITEGKRMLIKSEYTIKEIAFYLGFESLSSFSRFFKKHVRFSPIAYRKSMLE